MDTYFNFLIQANLALALLVLVYLFFLRQVPAFQLNRFLLLGFVAISLLVPFMPKPAIFTVASPTRMATVKPSASEVKWLLPTDEFGGELPTSEISFFTPIDWIALLTFLYCVGVLSLLSFFVLQLFSIVSIKQRAVLRRWKGEKFYYLSEVKGSFSFFNWIFLNEKWVSMNEHNKAIIYTHEAVHVAQKHSFDLLFVELGKAFFWINPAIWILKRELQLQHEYYVDEAIQKKFEPSSYAELLLNLSRKTKERHFITNSISNFSTLKKRIAMMTQPKSLALTWRYALLFPILIAVLFACSTFEEEEVFAESVDSKGLIQKVQFNGIEVHNNEGVFVLASRHPEVESNLRVTLNKNADLEYLKFHLVYGKVKIKSQLLSSDKNEFVLDTKIPSRQMLFEELSDEEGSLKILLEAKKTDGGTEIISLPVNYKGEISYDDKLTTIHSIYLNGKQVDLREGIDFDALIAKGKADFEIHVKQNAAEEITLTLAKGRKALFSKKKTTMEAGSVQKLNVPELFLEKEKLTKGSNEAARIIIEAGGSIVVFPLKTKNTLQQEGASTQNTIQLDKKTIDELAYKIGNDSNVILFVRTNNQIITNFHETGKELSSEEKKDFYNTKQQYVDNVKSKYPEWNNLPQYERNKVIRKALKIAREKI